MLFILAIHIDCMVDGAGESGDNASFAIKLAVEPRAPLIIAARFTPPIVKEKEEWLIGSNANCQGYPFSIFCSPRARLINGVGYPH